MSTQHRLSCCLIVVAAFVMFCPLCSMADSGQGPTKWLQRPDESPNGLDVRAHLAGIGGSLFLADDFLCTSSGPITDIHFWGSWLNDHLPAPKEDGPPADPGNVQFSLSIHQDVPVGPNNLFSRPGDTLWSAAFQRGKFAVQPWKEQVQEHFYDPMKGEVLGTDTVIWQYGFAIPQDKPFVQEKGNIYWLRISAMPEDDSAVLGWKTSTDHWNDDAAYGVMPGIGPITWSELRYPQASSIDPQLWGRSMDLAFALTTVPEPAGALLLAAACGCLMLRLERHSSIDARKS